MIALWILQSNSSMIAPQIPSITEMCEVSSAGRDGVALARIC
ncbi:hypothetical protein [Helicobacter mustelae]|nr:hypothetical protein [Helicobacter mustelae]